MITAKSIKELPYEPPFFTPIHWMRGGIDDGTGTFYLAIMSYLDQQNMSVEPEQLELVIAYLSYAINAPCWRLAGSENAAKLESLIERVSELETLEDVNNFIPDCLEIGLDPL